MLMTTGSEEMTCVFDRWKQRIENMVRLIHNLVKKFPVCTVHQILDTRTRIQSDGWIRWMAPTETNESKVRDPWGWPKYPDKCPPNDLHTPHVLLSEHV